MPVYHESETKAVWFSLWHAWFGDLHWDSVSSARAKRWFRSNPAHDTALCMHFGATWSAAGEGRLDVWADQPRGRLALILLCDQIGRNLWRGDPRAYALDPRAQKLCREGLASGADLQLSSLERVFFYFPLHHSEALSDQQDYALLLQALRQTAPEKLHQRLARFQHHAARYRKIITRFGRFPHRNAILGRTSTFEEGQYMRASSSRR